MDTTKQKRLSTISKRTRDFSASKTLLKMPSFRRVSRDITDLALEALPWWKQILWRKICSSGLQKGIFPSSHIDDEGLLILEKATYYLEAFEWLKAQPESSSLRLMVPKFCTRKYVVVGIKECELYFIVDKVRMAALMRNDPPPRISTTIFSNIDRNSIVDEWDLILPAPSPCPRVKKGAKGVETMSETSSPPKHTAESLTPCETQCSPSTSPDTGTSASPSPELTATVVGSDSARSTHKLNSMPGGWVDDEAVDDPAGDAPYPIMSEPGRWPPTTGYGDANSAPKSVGYRTITGIPGGASASAPDVTTTNTANGTATLLPPSRRYRRIDTTIIKPGIIFPVSASSAAYAQMGRGISEVDGHETYGPDGYAAVSGHQVKEGRWIENGKSEHEMGGYKQKKKGMKAVKAWWGDIKGNLIENARTWGVKPST